MAQIAKGVQSTTANGLAVNPAVVRAFKAHRSLSALLVYAEGFGDEQRVGATRALLEQRSDADLVVPLQCLGGVFGS
ncbi:MAG: hypothetical protein VKI83_06790 [Synechococcaceae cyanobacterium]|nr:hypothetical protein [Synechococcaceae cyanobacterium]